jgi:hypothetical protein
MSGDNATQTEAMARALGTRHCSNCQNICRVEGGGWKITNNGRQRRWQCVTCRARKNPSRMPR